MDTPYYLGPRYHLKDLLSEENCRATCTATNEPICFIPNKQFISFVSNGVKGLWVKVQLEETFDNVTIISKKVVCSSNSTEHEKFGLIEFPKSSCVKVSKQFGREMEKAGDLRSEGHWFKH